MSDYETNIRIVGELEIGIDEDEAAKWIANTINTARNILNIGMRNGPQTGRIYERANGIVHQASQTGQWPAVDSGNLRINTRMRFAATEGEIGSNVDYAEYLATGTSRMGARKLYKEALDLSIEEHADEIGDIIFIRQKAAE